MPEVAARHHLELINPVVDAALADAGVELGDVDALAVTRGPGLIGALLIGVSTADSLDRWPSCCAASITCTAMSPPTSSIPIRSSPIGVSGGGDVDGDGRGDLVLATWLVGTDGSNQQWRPGRASVVFGAPSGDTVWTEEPGPRLLVASGPALSGPPVDLRFPEDGDGWMPESSGAVASIVRDVTGDGRAEVLVGAERDPQARQDAGAAYLLRGRAEPGSSRWAPGRSRGAARRRFPGDGFGGTAAAAGDFDGDGRDDLLVAGRGSMRNGRARAGVAWILTGLAL